jgi:hypothetical protein
MALRKPSTLLLYNLSLSDLLIAVVQLPIYIVKIIGELNYDYELYCTTATYAYVVGFMLSKTSLFTVTAISIDRYLIIHKGVHYPEQVTNVRDAIVVVFIWASAILQSGLQYIVRRKDTVKIAGAFLAICVAITTASYCKMICTLRKMKIEASQLSECTNKLSSVARYRKTTVTMLLVFVVFMICYVPYLCTTVAISILGEARNGIGSAESIATVITYARSSINPIILFWRMREIQLAAKIILRKYLLLLF